MTTIKFEGIELFGPPSYGRARVVSVPWQREGQAYVLSVFHDADGVAATLTIDGKEEARVRVNHQQIKV
jgi:hypothetical protein